MIPWDHPNPQPNGISISSAVFAQTNDRQSVPILYNRTPILPQKFATAHGGIWTQSNTWFPGPNPNFISIGSAIFAGLTSMTGWQAGQQTTLLGW